MDPDLPLVVRESASYLREMLKRTFLTGTLLLAAAALVTATGGCADPEPTASSAAEIAASDGHGYRCFPCDPTEVNDLVLQEAEAFANHILGYAVGVSATCIDLGEGGSECMVWFATNDEGCETLKVDCTAALGSSRIRCSSSLGCGIDW